MRDLETGVEFHCGYGEGLTHAVRQEVWDNQDEYMGMLIKYRFQEHGTDVRPRSPSWLGFRDRSDM